MLENVRSLSFCFVFTTILFYIGFAASEENLFTSNQNCEKDLFPRPPCCGISNTAVGKSEASVELNVNEYPWIVFINGTQTKNYCSGSLINSRWVLTTAECVFNSLGYEWKLQVFIKSEMPENSADGTTNIQKYVVIKTILHESYDSLTEENSIALLRLNEPVSFSYVVKPICLPFNRSMSDFIGAIGKTAAWGTVENQIWQISYSCKADVKILDQKSCKESIFWDFTPEMCATVFHSVCFVHKGGPVMIPLHRKDEKFQIHYLIGLIHFEDLTKSNFAFVNLHKYLPWIQKTIAKHVL